MPQILPTLQLNSPPSQEQDLLIQILYQQGYLFDRTLPPTKDERWKFNSRVEDAVIYFQQTHLGPDGKSLPDTGIVDEATWWALKHPSGAGQKSNLVPSVPEGIGGFRSIVLMEALAEHAKGVHEKPNGSNRSKEIDTYFPDWFLKKLKPGEKGPAWCCFFVNAVVTKAFGGRRPWGPYIGSCAKLWETVNNRDWDEVGRGALPTPTLLATLGQPLGPIIPGDIFVMLHPKNPGKPQTGHVGFVLRVSKNNTMINTVEGNCGNRVKVGLRDTKTIYGFINPYGRETVVGFSRSLLATAAVGADDTR